MKMVMSEAGPVAVWDRAAEMMPRQERAALQLGRIRRLVDRLYKKSEFYRKALDTKNIKAADLKSLDDVRHLPFVTRRDVAEHYPFGMVNVPKQETVRLHISRTAGQPVASLYTDNDVEILTECCARAMTAAGIGADDIVQNTHSYGLFAGGLGMHYGSERVGALTVPISTGLTERQIVFMLDLGVTALVVTPSYALVLAEKMKEMGVDRSKMKLRVSIGGGDPYSDELRKNIEGKLGVKHYDVYGLLEAMGPGVACECVSQNGLHVQEDHFLAEIIDPDTLQPLPPGEMGELVLTTLTKEGMPMLRYRTGDVTWIDETACACGRTTRRIHKVVGRVDDMMVVKGRRIFPSQVEAIVLQHKELEPQYRLLADRVNHDETVDVEIEATQEFWGRGEEARMVFQKQLEKELQRELNVGGKVTVLAPKSLPRVEDGQVKRLFERK